MKSKLFTHKFFVVLCISVVALLGLSFLARATIVNNRFEQMAVDEKYSLKDSADGQFSIQFQDDENGNFMPLSACFGADITAWTMRIFRLHMMKIQR